jgi:two-component system OmpR family sensor kinase
VGSLGAAVHSNCTSDVQPGASEGPDLGDVTALSRLPLRLRLVAAVVALSGLALALTGVAATASLRGYLLGRVDDQLSSSLDRYADDFGDQSRRPDPLDDVFAEVLTASGTGVPRLRDGLSAPALPTSLPTGAFTVASVDGQHTWRVRTQTSTRGTVVVAVLQDDVEATVAHLVVLELAVGGGVLVLLAGLGYVVVRRSLKPLVLVERTAEAIAAGDLSVRVPESDPRTEVGSLSRSFNAMLEQIEDAFTERAASEAAARRSEHRMRRFVGDASHELRTPLTSIRGFAELYRQGALPAPADVDRAMSRVEGEAARMGGLVDDLLLLARLDQQRPLEQRPVDLVALAADAVHDAQAADPERPLSLVADVATCEVLGDQHRLTQVLANLLTNARLHTPARTEVRVHLAVVDGAAVLDVADAGPGIPVEERAQVFDRFYRSDESRTRASGGSGLGLSIVAGIVHAHRGAVEVLETPGGGATFRVSLPVVVGVPQLSPL